VDAFASGGEAGLGLSRGCGLECFGAWTRARVCWACCASAGEARGEGVREEEIVMLALVLVFVSVPDPKGVGDPSGWIISCAILPLKGEGDRANPPAFGGEIGGA
jgi:hypothetical protein